jgi:hypothetical protein
MQCGSRAIKGYVIERAIGQHLIRVTSMYSSRVGAMVVAIIYSWHIQWHSRSGSSYAINDCMVLQLRLRAWLLQV